MSRSLDLLTPKTRELALRLKALAKELLHLDIIFTNTLRTEEEQVALYSKGRYPLSVVNGLHLKAGMPAINESENKIVTKARSAKDSFHGYGLAFDIAIVDPTGKKIIWDSTSDWNNNDLDDWAEVGKLIKYLPGLEWGGNFSSIYDAPHFQYRPNNVTLAELKNGAPIG